MKFYTDNDKVAIVQTITSASTFISSITGTIKNHILKAFPKDYFRYIYTDTSESYQEFNKTDAHNRFLHKVEYPSLTISPQLSLDSPVGGMKNILMSSPNLFIPRYLNRQMPCLLEDPNNKYQVYFSSDYTTMNLRFKIIVDSFQQAAEIGYYLKSRFNDETFKYLSNQTILVEMPKSFINAIAKIENLFGSDIDDSITNAEDFTKMVNKLQEMGRRAGTIVPKRRRSNRRLSFYFENQANLLTLFTDLDIPEGIIRDSSVSGEYEVSFRVQISAWWPNAFIMLIDKSSYTEIADIIKVGITNDNNDKSAIYSTAIGSPIALDRKNSVVYADQSGEEHVGINIMHEIIQDENGWQSAWDKDDTRTYLGTTTINISSLVWGE